MSKRLHILMIITTIALIPSMIFAGTHKFAVTEANVTNNTVEVPLVVTNEANLAAMDIPLKFSEGVTLKEVNFENTRVDYFDLKVSNINNAERTVVIGLLPQMSAAHKDDLAEGTGSVATLVFEAEPGVNEVTIEAVELQDPGHSLVFVYHDYDQNDVPHIRVEQPTFEPVTIPFSQKVENPDDLLPKDFSLSQNYPNPFNPTTDISFGLPVASHVDVTIFNILGQEVKTLVDGEMEAGYHTVTWDADRYSSGVYFYRIVTNEFTDTKKMLMIK